MGCKRVVFCGGRGLNFGPYIYYALFIPTELSSQRRMQRGLQLQYPSHILNERKKSTKKRGDKTLQKKKPKHIESKKWKIICFQ